MSDEKPNLYAALAALQGELPHIDKSNVGGGDTKDGKKGPKYKYADLADVSQAILPLLSKHGLAFNSKPTMVDGEFGLLYKLVHKSGEKDEGFYPFGRGGSPQQVGSLITYARRYTLCAVTGAAPDADDDAAAAEVGHRSAGDVFENAAPARPQASNGNGNGAPRGQVARPAAVAQPDAAPADEIDPDAQEVANEVAECRTIGDLRDSWKRSADAKKLNAVISEPGTGEKMRLVHLIDSRRRELEEVDAALKEFHAAAEAQRMSIPDMELHVKRVTGKDFETATASQLRRAAEALKEAAA